MIQRNVQFLFLENGKWIVSRTNFVYNFSIKIFLLYSINCPNFITWLPSLLVILDKMCIPIDCFQECDIINFEIDLVFLIKPFFYMIKKSGQKFKYLENEKSSWGEIKSIFHHFWRAFSCQKFSQTQECTFAVCDDVTYFKVNVVDRNTKIFGERNVIFLKIKIFIIH